MIQINSLRLSYCNNMPPKGKGKHVHNTRSISARSRSNSPLRAKVTNNLAKPKSKEHSKQPLKSVVKVINSKQAKATNVSFAGQDPAQPASHPPKQTAFADAMEKRKRSMVHAINSVPTPCVGEQVATVLALMSHSQIFKQAAESVSQWDGALQLVEDDNPLLVACSDSDNGFGGRPSLQFGVDDPQLFPSGDVGQNVDTNKQAMDLDPEDNPLSPPRGRPTDAPVAAASAPQGALQLMAAGARQNQGKPPHFLLAKHVPDNIKRCIWANKYVDFQYLIESDLTEEIVYQFMASSNSAVTLKPAKPKSKLDGWVAWNKVFRMFTEIYCMKYPDRSIKLLQYSGRLNNLVGKFPFDQVYAYDKEFRADLESFPDKPWDQIDQQLWSLTLHGIHTMPHQENPQQYLFRKQQHQPQSAGWRPVHNKTPDNLYKNCFDHNRGGCSCPSCVFPHVCSRCGSAAHTTPY